VSWRFQDILIFYFHVPQINCIKKLRWKGSRKFFKWIFISEHVAHFLFRVWIFSLWNSHLHECSWSIHPWHYFTTQISYQFGNGKDETWQRGMPNALKETFNWRKQNLLLAQLKNKIKQTFLIKFKSYLDFDMNIKWCSRRKLFLYCVFTSRSC